MELIISQPLTEKLETEQGLKDEINKTQLVFGRIKSMAHSRSNLNKFSALTSARYLLHGTAFVSSHDFRTLHLCLHHQDLKSGEGYFQF